MIDLARWHGDLAVIGIGAGILITSPPWGQWARTRRLDVSLAGITVAVLLPSLRLTQWVDTALLCGFVSLLFVAAGSRSPDVHDQRPLGRFDQLMSVGAFVGLWATVPDTEAPLIAVTVLLPTLVLHRGGLRRREVATLVVLGVLAGDAGAADTPTAIAGAACCLVWLVLPGATSRPSITRRWSLVALGLHTLAVVLGSRLVAHVSVVPATIVAAIVTVSTVIAGKLAARSSSQPT